MHYLKEPGFWVAVVAVAIVVNFAWNYLTKRGKLV
jgi:hypothetical protein